MSAFLDLLTVHKESKSQEINKEKDKEIRRMWNNVFLMKRYVRAVPNRISNVKVGSHRGRAQKRAVRGRVALLCIPIGSRQYVELGAQQLAHKGFFYLTTFQS